MSTPNPLAPQGSLLERQGRGRSTFQVISFIGALHVFVLCALLWIGCKQDKPTGMAGGETPLPGQDGSLPPVLDPPPATDPATNLAGMLPPTNPPVVVPGTPGDMTVLPPPTARLDPVAPPAAPGAGAEATLTEGGTAAEHKVAAGETGTTIARKHGVTVAALKAANPKVNWNKLKVGQVLAIPAPTAKAPGAKAGGADAPGASAGAALAEGLTHTVVAGDTGTKIAKKHGVAWRKIRDLNGLTSDALRPGQKLSIPARGAATGGAAGAVPEAPAGSPVVPVVAPLPTGGGR